MICVRRARKAIVLACVFVGEVGKIGGPMYLDTVLAAEVLVDGAVDVGNASGLRSLRGIGE